MVTKISKRSRIQDSCQITPQTLITGSLCHAQHSLKISERSVHNFLSYLANTQTNRQKNKQTKTGKNITSLAEVKITLAIILKVTKSSGLRKNLGRSDKNCSWGFVNYNPGNLAFCSHHNRAAAGPAK